MKLHAEDPDAAAQAQRFLTEQLAVRDAVLLDNGADVRLSHRHQPLIPSSRPEIRGLLAVTARKVDPKAFEAVTVS